MYFYLSKILSPLLKPFNLIIFLLIFFYILNLKYKKKIFRSVIFFLFLFFLIISLFPLGQIGIRHLEKDYLFQKQIEKIDNIIVLAGPEIPGITKLTKKLNLGDGSERIIASVKLSLKFPNAKIYFLGGDGKLIKSQFDESDVAKIFYKDIGVNLSKVVFVNNSRNTIENLREFTKFKLSNENNVLITSAYHMKRSLMVAKYMKINVIPYAVDFNSSKIRNGTNKNKMKIVNFYQSYDLLKNLNALDIYVKELLGILAFNLFY